MLKKEIKNKTASFKISETKLDAFKSFCSLNEVTVSDAINQLIDKALADVKVKKKAKRG